MKNLNHHKSQHQILLELNRPPEARLENGIIGSNHETLAALRNFILSKYTQSKSFIIWGNQGSGKSFWLQAWTNEISNSKYFDLKHDILTEYTKKNILILDNLEFASDQNQSFVFRLFNLHETSNTKILASTACPEQLNNKNMFRQDLFSRMKQGLIYKLDPLSDFEKKLALKEYILSVGWLTSLKDTKYDPLLEYMLQRFPRQLPILKYILIKTHNSALANKCPVTIPLVKSIMEKVLNE
ncbi:MAG: DnaA ATPase domain-containing protein [Burkholderiaceae bacterium]|jgi:chromosomal replication initiation ATPase DnaA|tara:strand:+ start:486 stop:1208 length:723 start_codon:yes stop_codon:yes gene_type:complete